jgi:hypothetical protein
MNAVFLRNTNALLTAFLILLYVLVPARAVDAHEMGWSYVFVDITESGISGRMELPLDQLKNVVEIDVDRDGILSEDEVRSTWPLIEEYATSILRLGNDASHYPVTVTGRDRLVIEIADYAIVKFSASTPTPVPPVLSAEFRPFFEANAQHRGGLVIENNIISGDSNNHSEIKLVFSPRDPSGTVSLLKESVWTMGWRFVVEGIWHIWIGIDHVLFLVTLLLTAVMALNNKRWEPEPDYRKALFNLFAIVTLFTIAHSITLALAIKGWVTLSSRFVESIIALSVLIVALNNIRPVISHQIRWLVFIFGLFHGLGFASVLIDLLVSRQSKLTALIGFNIGVEIGQLVIVALVFPILYMIRETNLYRRVLLPGVSAVVALVGLWWFVTRSLGLESFITSF